jgi:hypothetical protein
MASVSAMAHFLGPALRFKGAEATHKIQKPALRGKSRRSSRHGEAGFGSEGQSAGYQSVGPL